MIRHRSGWCGDWLDACVYMERGGSSTSLSLQNSVGTVAKCFAVLLCSRWSVSSVSGEKPLVWRRTLRCQAPWRCVLQGRVRMDCR